MSTVLFVSYTAQVSGAEKMMLTVAAEALRAGKQVTVACPTGPLCDSLPAGATHLPIPELSLGGKRGLARLAAAARLLARWQRAGRTLRPLARARDTDTVVNSVFALPAARLANLPRKSAWLVHDAMTNRLQRYVIQLSKGAVRVAVACTEAAAGPIRDLGLPVEVVPYGVPWPVESFAAGLHQPPVVGMLSLLTPWKGHQVVLDALARLPGVTAEFAGGNFPGDAAYVDELRTRAAESDLAGRVHFLGHVDPESVMSRWDILISASTSPEAGPLAVLEAMSHGLPVIATDHGGPREFLRDGVGLLVPPGEPGALAAAIQSLLTDSVARQRMSQDSRLRIGTEHDINRTLPALLQALTS